MEPAAPQTPVDPASQPRREFLKTATCLALGGCALAAPIGAAIVVLAHPLKSKGVPLPVRITTLSALPASGVPKFFQVVTERRDAWTKVRLPSGTAGWVPAGSVEPVSR